MNFGQLQTAVYEVMGLDTADGLITPTFVSDALNRGLHSIECDADWPWLQAVETITTAQGVDAYTPAAGWKRTLEIRDDTARVLERYSITELDDRWNVQTQGKPRMFAIFADQIVVRGIPDGVYALTHRYYRFEPVLTNPSDTPLIPDDYHGALVEYAAFLGHRRARDAERANLAWNTYLDWKKRMAHTAKRRVDTPGRIRVRPGGML